MKMLRIISFLLSTTTFFAVSVFRFEIAEATTTPETAAQPHILFALIDDLGWNNVQSHAGGATGVRTPHIDALRASGVELDRHYSYKFCSPSISFAPPRARPFKAAATPSTSTQ